MRLLVVLALLHHPAFAQPANVVARCRTDANACFELAAHSIDSEARHRRCDRGDRDVCVALAAASAAANPGGALPLYQRACALGHPAACGLAAHLVLLEAGPDGDPGPAIRLYERACRGGDAASCAEAGMRVERTHRAAAARLYERACLLGAGAGCRGQAMLLGPRADRARFCALLNAGCHRNDLDACGLVALRCSDLFPRALANQDRLHQLEQECESSQTSCGDAGKLREGAAGVARMLDIAEALYAKGCVHGERASCRSLARVHTTRMHALDRRKTLADGCARALPGLCTAAGVSELAGDLGRPQPALAIASFERACTQADSEGCLQLARTRRDRIGGAVDVRAIVESFRTACVAGSIVACREGARVDAGARAWFDEQECFRRADGACPTAAPIAHKTIRLDGSGERPALVFAGPDGRGLLASRADSLALLDPIRGRVAVDWTWVLASVPSGSLLRDGAITSSSWRWDAGARSLFGVIGATATGGGVDAGMFAWSPAAEPRLALAGTAGVLALSPDRRRVVAVDHAGGARLVDLPARQLGARIGKQAPRAVAFAADGSLLAIGFDRGELAIVTTATGAATLIGASGVALQSLSFHPARPLLVAVDADARVRLWRLDALDRGPTLVPEPAHAAAFRPDGRHLALVRNAELVLLDATTLWRVAKAAVSSTSGAANPLVFSADSRYAATANDGTVTVFDLDPSAPAPPIDATWFATLQATPAHGR